MRVCVCVRFRSILGSNRLLTHTAPPHTCPFPRRLGVPSIAYALPYDPEFWPFLLGRAAKAWGLKTYEQDWLWVQFLGMQRMLESATLGREWLLQMGEAALANDVSIEYCMALPRHAMQSVEIPAVTQIRASDDYGPDHRFWQVRFATPLLSSLHSSLLSDLTLRCMRVRAK